MEAPQHRILWIIIIILALIVIGFSLFYFYNYTLNKGYQLGRGDLIIDMNINSYFPVIIQQNNQTLIKNTALQEICSG